MNIYDVQNTQYALSVLDEIEHLNNPNYTETRYPIYSFNNHFITGDFILKSNSSTTYEGSYSITAKNEFDIKIINHGLSDEAANLYQVVALRRLIFSSLKQSSFDSSYEMPNELMELNFVQQKIKLIDTNLKPQNDLLVARGVNFGDLKITFDTYQFNSKDQFELVSIRKKII